MPVEGQADRVRTPLAARDRRLLLILGVATALAVAAGVVYALTRPARSDAGCVEVTIPASVGGSTIRSCGAAAVRFCHTSGPTDDRIAAACRRAGYAVPSKP